MRRRFTVTMGAALPTASITPALPDAYLRRTRTSSERSMRRREGQNGFTVFKTLL